MANKSLFKPARDVAPKSDMVNLAGGVAYKLDPKAALAQIAMTGTFNGTFYAKDSSILEMAKKVAQDCAGDPKYIAQVAIASREQGYMKDMPAFLVCMLAELDTTLFRQVFNRVIDNGRMLRNVVQIARSGQLGKVRNLSAGTYRKAFQNWFSAHSSISIWKASIGSDPSMRDILRMCRPRPDDDEKAALYAYLNDRALVDGKLTYRRNGVVITTHDYNNLPDLIIQYEKYKKTKEGGIPNVDYRFLASLDLGKAEWIEIAKKSSYMMTRMNLNTFARHGVFEDKKVTKIVADRLRDPDALRGARQFPYQLLSAWKAAVNVPHNIRMALQDAIELATANVPAIGGKVYICVDVSGSMEWPITGTSRNAWGGYVANNATVRCVEVAALFAASVARLNPDCEILIFSDRMHPCCVNPRDTIFTNVKSLISSRGGGTNCSIPLRELNKTGKTGDAVVYISDYESWIDSTPGYRCSDGTQMHQEWLTFKKRNKNAKLICLDLTPRDNTQVKERPDILNVGGFSDQVFEVVHSYLETGGQVNRWMKKIQQIEI